MASFFVVGVDVTLEIESPSAAARAAGVPKSSAAVCRSARRPAVSSLSRGRIMFLACSCAQSFRTAKTRIEY